MQCPLVALEGIETEINKAHRFSVKAQMSAKMPKCDKMSAWKKWAVIWFCLWSLARCL